MIWLKPHDLLVKRASSKIKHIQGLLGFYNVLPHKHLQGFDLVLNGMIYYYTVGFCFESVCMHQYMDTTVAHVAGKH